MLAAAIVPSGEATRAVAAVVIASSVAGYTGYFYSRPGFGFLVEKAGQPRGREFLEFGIRSPAGTNFGPPPAAELSPLLGA